MALDDAQFGKVNTWLPSPPNATHPNRNREMFASVQLQDTVAAATAAGYYNAVRDILQVGDVIMAIGSDGHRVLLVTAVPDTGNVTTANKAAA